VLPEKGTAVPESDREHQKSELELQRCSGMKICEIYSGKTGNLVMTNGYIVRGRSVFFFFFFFFSCVLFFPVRAVGECDSRDEASYLACICALLVLWSVGEINNDQGFS
jgi:hypothetical protein